MSKYVSDMTYCVQSSNSYGFCTPTVKVVQHNTEFSLHSTEQRAALIYYNTYVLSWSFWSKKEGQSTLHNDSTMTPEVDNVETLSADPSSLAF